MTHVEISDPIPTSWVRLYENFNGSPDIGTWTWDQHTASHYLKQDLKIQLKSYDIGVANGIVQLWAIYPDDPVASSSATGVSGFGGAYSDTLPPDNWNTDTNAYRAIGNYKYRKIAEAKSGEHIKGYVDFPVKRVMIFISSDL